MSSVVPGSATHAVGKAESEAVEFVPLHKQGILVCSLDKFVLIPGVPFPNHIKIDVDGNERLIIENALNTLADPRLKSLAIEISENISHGQIERLIESKGFSVVEREEWESEKHGKINNIIYVRTSKIN